MDAFPAIAALASLGAVAFFAVREGIKQRSRHRRWQREFEEALRDPSVRGAIVTNLDLEIAACEVSRESGNGARRATAATDLAMLHLYVAGLYVEDGALADAARHLDDVPAAHVHGEFARLRAVVTAALESARARHDGRTPLR